MLPPNRRVVLILISYSCSRFFWKLPHAHPHPSPVGSHTPDKYLYSSLFPFLITTILPSQFPPPYHIQKTPHQFSQPPYKTNIIYFPNIRTSTQLHHSLLKPPQLLFFIGVLVFFDNMKKEKTSTASKLSRCLKAPIRVLCRARDLYVKSMTGCAGRVHYSVSGSTLPRSFSVNSSRMSEDEDIRALMRALSQRSQMEAAAASATAESMRSARGLPKSNSMGIGRIDEEKPCYFPDELKVKSDVSMYPRSRSYAVPKRTGILA